MGVEFSILRDRRVVVSTMRGKITGGDILDYQRRIWTDPTLAGFNELMDFSDVTKTEASVEDIRELARQAHAIDVPVPTRTAVVGGTPLVVTGGHIFKALRESFPDNAREIRVFPNVQQARLWLGLPAGEKDLPKA